MAAEVIDIEDVRTLEVPEIKESWAESELIGDICRTLIERWPRRFGHLGAETLGFYWRKNGGRSKRKDALSGSQIVADTSLLMHHARQKVIVWLAADHVKGRNLTEKQAEALCFRELSRIGKDAKGRPVVQDYDFHGFRAELQEYGHWNPELEKIANLQLGLGFKDEDEEKAPE